MIKTPSPRTPRLEAMVAAILLLAVNPVLATPTLPLVGCLPGALTDFQLTESHVFCATYAGLLALDLSTPNPTPVSFTPMPDDARGLAIRDNLAYLAPKDVGLRILDVADPAHPVEIGSCPLPGGYGDLILGANHAYACDQYHGIRVFDITDPTAPVQVSFLALSHQVRDLELVGSTLYAAANNAGLRIIDVSDPAVPVLTETVDVWGNVNAVKVRGAHAYVAAGLCGLKIYDIHDEEVALVGEVPLDFDLPFGSWCEDLDLVGDLAYVTLSGAGIGVVDVSDPAAPVEVVARELTGRARRIAVRDDTAYAGCWNGGLRLVDISDPNDPRPTGEFELLGEPQDLRVEDGLVYIAGGYSPPEAKRSGARNEYTGGLYIVDMAEPAWPEIIAHSSTDITPTQIALGGGLAFLSCVLSGVQIVDVADPHAPQWAGEITATGAYFHDVEVQDGIAFVSDEYNGIRSFDVSDPAAPVELGALDGEYWPSFEPHDDYLYAAAFYDGLRVIDISDPSLLRVVGSVDLPNYAISVHVAGDRAYVANGNRGLSVIDISVPESPVELGVFDTPDHAVSVVVADGLAYVADSDAGIRVIDVSDPAAMVEVACNEFAQPARSVAVDENYVYAACWLGGLFVLERLVPTGAGSVVPPRPLRLDQNYPNPFNPQTVIRYELPVATAVDLRVFDLAGRLVATLASDRHQAAGPHAVSWNGADDGGRPAPAGTYIYRLEAGGSGAAKSMVLVR